MANGCACGVIGREPAAAASTCREALNLGATVRRLFGIPALWLKVAGRRKNRHGHGHEGLSSSTNEWGEDEQAFHFPVPGNYPGRRAEADGLVGG